MTPRTRTRWSRRRWVIVMGAALLAVALLAWWAIASSGSQDDGPGTEVVRATRSTQTSTVSLSGVLAPQQQARVSFRVAGTVDRISARVGDEVRAGQELAALEDRDLRNAVALAEAQLTAARAQLQTAQEADQVRSAQVAAARAQVSSAQAAVDQARDRLADAALASPIDGVVAEVAIEVGDQVTGTSASLPSGGAGLPSGLSGIPGLTSGSQGAGSGSGGAAIVVVVPGSWQLDATVGTADLPSLQPGQPAIATPTGTSTHVAAVVDTVGIVASGSSGSAATFPVTLKITETTANLYSGSDANAVVTTGRFEGVLTIPEAAIQFRGNDATIRRAATPTTDEVVTLGRRFSDRVEVLSGLDEGDEVVARKGVTVQAPPRPQFGPGGSIASPDPTPSARS